MENKLKKCIESEGWLKSLPEKIIVLKSHILAENEDDLIEQLNKNKGCSIGSISSLPSGKIIADIFIFEYLSLDFKLLVYDSEKSLEIGVSYHARQNWLPIRKKFSTDGEWYQNTVRAMYKIM